MRRLFSLIIPVLLCMLISTPAHALFFDVPENHPYAEAIDYFTRAGIIKGYDNRSFRPDISINRAEFTKMLMEVLLPEEYINRCPDDLQTTSLGYPAMRFADVHADDWFTPAVCSAWINGIINGYPDGTFRPAAGITFVEAAKMLALSFGLTSMELPDLGAQNQLWYKPYVDLLSGQHAIPGSIGSLVHPVTRGEMAEMLYRLRNFPLDLEPIDTYSKTTDDLPTYPVDWAVYENRTYGFSFQYPNVWPTPTPFPRGVDEGVPYLAPLWSLYFGPAVECPGACLCAKREMWVDVYPRDLADTLQEELLEYDQVELLPHAPVHATLPTLVILEVKGGCVSKRAFLFGEHFTYGISIKCGADSDRLSHMLDSLVQGWSEITIR